MTTNKEIARRVVADGNAAYYQHRRETWGMVGQWLAVFLVGIGIGIEWAYKAHVGFVFITVGSLVLALATKVKYYRRH